MSIGCNNLIRNHQAHLLQSAEDIVRILNWDITDKPKSNQQQLFIDLSSEEQKIVDYLQKSGQELMDVLAFETNIPVHQLATILLQMELKQIVKPLPGKLFDLA
jgi:DNA processing protein